MTGRRSIARYSGHPEDDTMILPMLLLTVAADAFLLNDVWNDGQAEIAFYQVERELDQYGRPNPQSFLMGTYLVKHDYDRARQSKSRGDVVDPVSSFKWAAFYEFESDNSYQYKRNYVVNATQAELEPLKQSYTSFDWCSNQYRELAFDADGNVDYLMRSDDYGNEQRSFTRPDDAYPITLVPLLVRAFDFTESSEHAFTLLLEDGSTVPVRAELEGRETIELPAGTRDAERIRLRYDGEYRSYLSRRGAAEETYWRGLGPDRQLLAIDSEQYRVRLVEHVRSSYWKEDVYDKLRRVTTRP